MAAYSKSAFSRWVADLVVPKLPNESGTWTPRGIGAYREPVGWFLTGFVAERIPRGVFYLHAYVMPLFSRPRDSLNLTYGAILSGPEKRSFDIPSPMTAHAIAAQVHNIWHDRDADSFLAQRGSVEGFLDWIAHVRSEAPISPPEVPTGYALEAAGCHILRNDLTEARTELSYVIDKPEPYRNDEEVEIAVDLARRLSHGRDRALDRLAELRDAALAAQLNAF